MLQNITKINNSKINNTKIHNTKINNTKINNTKINNTKINNTKNKRFYIHTNQLNECRINPGCIWCLHCECENCKKLNL